MSDPNLPTTPTVQPLGALVIVIGLLALTVGLVGEFSGIFEPLEFEIRHWILGSSEFGDRISSAPSWFRFAYGAGAAFLTPAALLAIHGRWRRVLCWVVAAFLTLSLSLVLLFFDLWFSPLTTLLTGLWAGLGSFYHLSHLSRSTAIVGKEPLKEELGDPLDLSEESPSVAELDEDDEWKEFRAKK